MLQQIDEVKVNQFAEKLLGTLNSAGLALMISIGHRTRLFDVMAEMPPATSGELALAANLQERYVREWLGAMVAGRLVEYDPDTRQYWFPREHAAMLTRAASPNNLGPVFQFVGMLGSVENKVVKCFHEGGGVPYCLYCNFHGIMAEESGQTVVAALKQHLLPLAPGLREKLAGGIRVLDVGCGRGRAMRELARLFPNSHFTGIDFSEEAIDAALDEGAGYRNLEFRVADAATFDEPEAYDVIFSFDSVHDQARPDLMLSNIHRALKPGGLYFMQDIGLSSNVEQNIDHPLGAFTYTISCMHCMSVSLANGGMGLGAAWGVELAERMLREAGFRRIQMERLPHDIQNVYVLSWKD